ncbi:hypothetical protein ALC60_11789, partial [Trachymyrmex zeteki]
SIYPPSGMILHPGAHFGDFPHPIGSGESRPFRLFPESSPLARADFASSPPRRVVRRHRVRFTDDEALSYPAAAPRLRGFRSNGDEGRKDWGD